MPKDELDEFIRLSYTIGGMRLFASNPVDGKHTIIQARGVRRDAIGDRFDLTLECIRRYYLNPAADSPLASTLARYPEFFALFRAFRGYADFLLLHDLVTDDYSAKRFITDFSDLSTPAVPQSLEEFNGYRERSIEFVQARYRRIAGSAPSSAAADLARSRLRVGPINMNATVFATVAPAVVEPVETQPAHSRRQERAARDVALVAAPPRKRCGCVDGRAKKPRLRLVAAVARGGVSRAVHVRARRHQ